VTSIETEEGRRWAEQKITALTGGDEISARFMRQDYFDYTPHFKLVIAGNHKPGLRSVNEAIRRRLHLHSVERRHSRAAARQEARRKAAAGMARHDWP
jgi:phage/plasmid-associated DNA primase